MRIKPEKCEQSRLYAKSRSRDLDYSLLVTFFNDIIVNFNRYNFNTDTVIFVLTEGALKVKYRNLQNFDWYFDKNSTYGKMVDRLQLNVSVEHGEYSELNINGQCFNTVLEYSLKLSDIEYVDKYSKAFEWCKSECLKILCSDEEREVIFETLLNIVQHEYRDHSDIDTQEIVQFMHEYFTKNPLTTNEGVLYVLSDISTEILEQYLGNNREEIVAVFIWTLDVEGLVHVVKAKLPKASIVCPRIKSGFYD